MLFFIMIISMIFSSASKKEKEVVAEGSILHLKLKGSLKENGGSPMDFETGIPFMDELSRLGLYEIREAIKAAEKDTKIKGLFIEPESYAGGWATTESLRDAIVSFKASGKFVYSYADYYSEKAWYLASAGDESWVHPFGIVEMNGLSSNPMFMKGLFAKIGVKPKVFRVGTFKSAVEPFIEDKMSDANRKQTQELLDDIWNHFIATSAASKKLTAKALDAIAEGNQINSADDAVRFGLVNGTAYRDKILEKLGAKVGKEKTKDIEFVSIRKYINGDNTDNKKGDKTKKVAIVFASGEIVDGKGSGDNIGGDKLAEQLRKLREDENVKAVVLRVNSPGGSGLASDIIWREMLLLQKAKPTVVSMGDVAASGGYFIAAPADMIFAEANTITGSIGVFGLMMNTEELFNSKLGITFDKVATNPYADLGNPNRKMTPEEENYIQNSVNQFYGRFINVVKEGRHFPDSVGVDAIAQGRVWSGMQALKIGLVDSIGGLDDAIQFAVNKAGLGTDYRIKKYPEEEETWKEILKAFGVETMAELKTVQGFEKEMAMLVRG